MVLMHFAVCIIYRRHLCVTTYRPY